MSIYRKIPSLKFLYEINEDGKIRNIKSKHMLKQRLDKDGYYFISYKDTTKRVHRLVAEVWCNTIDKNIDTLEVNHKDFNRQNNHYKNLEWVTTKENLKYSLDRRLDSLKKSDKNKEAYMKTFSNYNEIQSCKLLNIELNITFSNSVEAAKYISELLNKTNISSIARQIRKKSNSKNSYAYGYHWKRINL